MSQSDRPAADRHVSVLLDRCLELLAPALEGPDAVVVDATLGMGGHAAALLERHPNLRLVGIDRDPQALKLAGERLAGHGTRATLVHSVHDRLPEVLADLGLSQVDGVLLDLGVSSLQLDEADRGFAYAQDAPLDMRMDPTRGPTAADVLNGYSTAELTRVLRDYGEERFARRIAETVVDERRAEPFANSARLVELLYRAIPAPARRTGGHPAKRTFQALRVEVNDELRGLERAIPAALSVLRVGGRLVVMSFQSLEDRLVKRALVPGSTSSAPPGLPVELPEHQPYLRSLTRGSEAASEAEIESNSRAASVRLRAVERVRAGLIPESAGNARSGGNRRRRGT